MGPTWRWVCQLLDGLHCVRVTVQGHVHERIEGLTDVNIKLLRLFGARVCCLDPLAPG
jgi:hypothetical protein